MKRVLITRFLYAGNGTETFSKAHAHFKSLVACVFHSFRKKP